MQSLEVKFFKPLNTYIASTIPTKLREEPVQTVNRKYYVGGRHGVPKGCNDGNVYELVQE
jgi:hypothetical protein